MSSLLRTGLANLNSTRLLVGLCKKRCDVTVNRVARISGRELRHDRPPRPPPYDWKNKKYGRWNYLRDPMLQRFDDNTKVVVVEGMPAVGKDKFAKKLAAELEMKYIPPPNFDDLWINPYGFDHRSLNDKLPVDAQFYDLETFLKNPKHINVAAMQVSVLWMRCNQYIDALAHVLSTGEGVVVQRTPWTDPIFMQAMATCGFVSKGALDYHKCAFKGTVHEFLRPHLVLYLDAPISVIKQNIERRNIPYEVNSEALTDEYLRELEKLYKEYLKEMNTFAHLLIYDWSTEGDIAVVVEDIERLDFENVKADELKFHEWRWERKRQVGERRHEFCMNKFRLLTPLCVARFDVPEMLRSAHDSQILEQVMEGVPSERWEPGFDPEVDKGILFKTAGQYDNWVSRGTEKKEK